MTTDYRPAAEAAANWWAEQVGDPVFRNGSEFEKGESRFMTAFGEAAMSVLADKFPVTEEETKSFAERLADAIEAELSSDWFSTSGRDPYLSISVDYHPDPILRKAAEAAKVSAARFPIKTHMTVHADHVTASLGYGQRTRLIWHSEGWEHPTCDNHAYSEGENWHRLPFNCSKPRYHEDGCVFDKPVTLCQYDRGESRGLCLHEEREYPHQQGGMFDHEFQPTAEVSA